MLILIPTDQPVKLFMRGQLALYNGYYFKIKKKI